MSNYSDEDRVLYDTNAFIARMHPDTDFVESRYWDSLPVIAIATLGELHLGAAKSARIEANRRLLRRALIEVEVIPPDENTAILYGELMAALERRGTPLPMNDVWIAATAVQHGLQVLTRDKHFDLIDRIEVLRW